MPKELRKIIFTNKEVLRAVQDYAIRRREPIPAGSIKGVSMVDQPEVRLDIDMLSDKDQSRTTTSFGSAQLAAALIMYCIAKKIPVPVNATKTLSLAGDEMVLNISL